jgi:hypothetical protein
MLRAAAVLVLSLFVGSSAFAQGATTVSQLIRQGYQIKWLVALGTATVALQKGTNAYMCYGHVEGTPSVSTLAQRVGALPCAKI